MKLFPAHRLPRILSGAIAALLFGIQSDSAQAATFNWANVPGPGNFSDPAKWNLGAVPSGTDPSDILVFGGDVGTNLTNTSYLATNDLAANPFLLNQIVLQATNAAPGTGPVDTIAGATTLLFGGVNPAITQNETASVVINAPIRLGANLLLTGSPPVGVDTQRDKANVTLNGTLSGNFDIAKSGTSTFRFGSAGTVGLSDNTWFGTLTINEGTIRFNNNAFTAPTALRANPVVMNSATAVLTTQFKQLGTDPESSLRLGTLSGSAGTVEARRETATANVFDSTDISITALSSGSFGGTVRNNQFGGGGTGGSFTLRGVGTQAFTGSLDLSKDVRVGDIATMVIGGSASLGGQTSNAAIIFNGGTLRLDNTMISNNNRLRNGSSTSTGVETIGGGTFSLVSNAAIGVQESVARLQLGSAGNSRSGALTINITHNAPSGITSLNFESFARDSAGNPYDTVNFTANAGGGAVLPLGAATDGARVTFVSSGAAFNVPVFNGLLGNTGASPIAVGWATVNGSDFAAYGAQGVFAAVTGAAPDGTGSGDPTANAALTGNLALSNAGGYALNSLKIAPAAAGQTLDLGTAGHLFTNAFLLAGPTDFTINSTGGGGIANGGATAPRYFHVTSAMLTVNAGINAVGAVVKSGLGTLVLTNAANIAGVNPVVLNEGALRATPGTSLPAGELRFRGGVLEITGGGTFTRQIGPGTNQLTWSGIDGVGAAIGQEQGSGGFAAFGAPATVNLTSAVGNDSFNWEDNGFVNSGHALLFGSTRANASVTWVDNLNLTATDVGQPKNYNARQFRAIDNPNSTADVAVLSGTISGTLREDFLKTGNGEIMLTGTNTFQGATLITDGTLRVNGSTATSSLTDVRGTGTLGGAGTLGDVQVEGSGTVAPGNLAGNASILNTANLKFASGTAKLAIEIGGTNAGTNSVAGYDRVNVIGGVTLGGGALTGSLLNGFTAVVANLFFIIVNDGTDAVQGTFAQGSFVTIGTQTFSIGYTGNSATSTFTGGNDVVLRLVPEPGTVALLALGALGLAMRRRRA